MNDLISRQAAIEAIEEYADRLQMVNWKENPSVPYKAFALNWCINTIRDLPSAERKKGKWIDQDEGAFYPVECSECHKPPLFDVYGNNVLSNYCPNCGARMIEEGANDEPDKQTDR